MIASVEIVNALTNAIVEGTTRYSLSGQTLFGKAVSLYDGDTFDVVLSKTSYTDTTHLNKIEVVRHTVRMLGYNAVEIRQPLSLPVEERKRLTAKAICQKNHLSQLIGLDLLPEMRPILVVECNSWDKYGRLLANIYVNNELINAKMSNYCNE